MIKFGLLLCCMIAITGCQITSGQLRSKAVPCIDVESAADFRGSKPQWNVFSDVTGIQYCKASRQTQHKFTLESGFGSSQISNSDVVVFNEITERVFRELLFLNKEFQPIAYSTEVKYLSNNGRPTFYALKPRYKRPAVYFVMNDGYPASVSLAWSQIHIGMIKSPIPMSLEDFEAWFLKTIRTFKYTGGDYSSAFIALAKKSNASKSTNIQTQGKSGPADAMEMTIVGRWEGVSDTFKGYMTATAGTKTGSIVISLPDQKDRCFGIWSVTSGEWKTDQQPKGVWSVECESKQSATGEFVAEKSWHGLGEGRDSKDRTITFYYKPKSE